MAAEYELTLNDYLEILRRRAVLIAATFVAILAVSLLVAVLIKPVYESTGTILIESQKIPLDLVQGANSAYADELIAVVRQRVMTRENLQKIIDKYRLYGNERGRMTGSELIDLMRENVSVRPVNTETKRNNKAGTIAFTISFDYVDAYLANKVANELVTLFLDENVKSRTERATETTEFMKQEAERQKAALEKSEALVADYKRQHGNALPEQMELQMTMLQRTEEDLRAVERDYKAAQEELHLLEIDLSAAHAGMAPLSSAAGAMPLATELEKLKAEYAKMTSTYTENHPSVRALRRKIEALEKSDASTQPTQATTKEAAPVVSYQESRIQAKIDMTKAKVAAMNQQQQNLRARIRQLEGQLAQVPQVELGLTALMRDHEVAKRKYDEVVAKLTNAKISENLETENKAERFTLLEPPQVPDKPIKPNRIKIALLGFLLSIAGSGGLAMLAESINRRIRGVDAITALVGQRPLGTIPYVSTQTELNRRKVIKKYAAVSIVSMIIVALMVIHFLVMPLDILIMKLEARF